MPDTPLPPDTVYLSLPPPPKRRYLLRIPTACALILLTAIIVGCMSISFGGRSCESHDDNLLEQEGTLRFGPECQTVYYPIPYASPPNLTLDMPFHALEIEEQAPDHFKVRMTGAVLGAVTWKAKGLRAPPPHEPPAPIYAPSPVAPSVSAKP